MTTTTPSVAAVAGKRRGANGPGILFAALAVVLAILVVTALQPSQPPPPAVAEYAPEAVQAIKDAPAEQASDSGIGPEGGGGGTAGTKDPDAPTTTTTTTPTTIPGSPPTTKAGAPVIEQARVRRCVGDPPRQTEDPQSPPCVPYFQGANGGATSPGVSGNEIRIVAPSQTGDDMPQLLRYFNTRYELYGRQLVLVPAGCFGGSPSSAKNLADSVAKMNVFASMSFCDIKGSEQYYYDELAKKKVVSVNSRPYLATEKDIAPDHPYAWTYLPTYDKGARHLAELACSMNGQTASHAGAAYLTSTRKFGLITQTFADAPTPDSSGAIAALNACGITPLRAEINGERDTTAGQGASQQTIQQSQSAILSMQQAGVTTVLVLTHSEVTKQIYAAMSTQAYEPEVGISTYMYNDQDLFFSTLPTAQASHSFGSSTWNRFQRVADEPWYQAINEVDPGHAYTYAPGSYFGALYDYRALQVIAAGIQLAGPNLTPETFAAGLQKAKWPNPVHPSTPGRVTVGPGTHSYMEDAAVIWWDPTGSNPEYGGNGEFCYVGGGTRFKLGAYPKGAPGLFARPCQRF